MGLVALYVVVLAAVLYPLAATEIPPLVDYPNHLARFHILADMGRDPALRSNYLVHWSILPNLGLDLIALPLVRLLGTYDAGRVVVALAMLAPLLGTVALHRVLHGRLAAWPLFSAALVFNWVLFWGFLNYLFAAGLAMMVFAAWIATEGRNVRTRTAAFSAAAIVLFFCHMIGLGIYALAVVAYEIRRRRGSGPWKGWAHLRSLAPVAVQFVAPAALWLITPASAGGKVFAHDGPSHKLMAALSPVVFSGSVIDRVAIVVVGVLLIRGVFSRALRVDPRLSYPLAAVGACAVVMPTWLFGAWGADIRLPLVLLCLFVAATNSRIARPALRHSLTALVLALVLIRSHAIQQEWRTYDRDLAAFRRAVAAIAPASALLVASDEDPTDLRRKPYWHMASIAVIERAAFTPSLFADPGKQPIRVAPRRASLSAIDVSPLTPEVLRQSADPRLSATWRTARFDRAVNRFWVNWPNRFDYVLYLHDGGAANPVPQHLVRVAGGASFDIYQVRREKKRDGH